MIPSDPPDDELTPTELYDRVESVTNLDVMSAGKMFTDDNPAEVF